MTRLVVGDNRDAAEEDEWIPLVPDDDNPCGGSQAVNHLWSKHDENVLACSEDEGPVSSSRETLNPVSCLEPVTDPNGMQWRSNDRKNSLSSIQRVLEAKQTLRAGFIEHPLSLLPNKLLSYLTTYLWNQDPHVHAGK